MNNKNNDIINQLIKYKIYDTFLSNDELNNWLLELNNLEKENFLSLNIDSKTIKFDSRLLINKNLLNCTDYVKKVEAFVSIKNADGWYHLFDSMLNKDFLNSNNFYRDIETMKRAKSAQMCLWIIGDSNFINSPYHDEDFEMLVTAKDKSNNNCDFLVWDAIATTASNIDSINSQYHRQDLQTILKYSSNSLQGSCTFPEGSINNLAINKVSLKDKYHLENMDILARNRDIGSFLYAVMTDEEAINKSNYRNIIREMLDYKDNIHYVFLMCYYAVGLQKAKRAQNIIFDNYLYDIEKKYNIEELLKKIDEKINFVDSEYKETTRYEIENNTKLKRKIFKKNRI